MNMLKNYRSYLDYKELRRRIEALLSKSRNVQIHAWIFIFVNAVMWWFTWPRFYYPETALQTYVPGLITTAWSFILLVHSLWSYFHSGLWPGKREAAIEAEMSALYQEHADHMDDDDFFQIHQMLNEDIHQRAGYQFSLSMFAFANAFFWIIWILDGTHFHVGMTWEGIGFAAFVFLLGGGIVNFWRSGQHEQKRMQANLQPAREKRQSHESRYFATPEHGRLEIVDDDSPLFDKRKR
jgi:hypothetical protein